MKKVALSFVAVFLISTTIVSAQSLKEVLDNHFEVIGQEKILEAKSAQTKGKMIQMGIEIPFNQFSMAPKNFRIEATFQELTIIQTYNGKEGWSFNPLAGMTEPQPMGEDELKSTEIQADYEGMLWNWEDKGYTVTLEENEEVEGADCYVIKVVSKDEDTFTYYLDTESYVPIKMSTKVKIQGQEVESDTFMSNYKEGDGFVYAGKIESKMNGQTVSTIIIDEMTLGTKMDQESFGKPKI